MKNKKIALVTGASEGIGRVFAERLAKEGYAITAVARNEVRLKELMTELASDGNKYQVADLATKKGTNQVSDLMEKQHYNLLINNAGLGIYGPFYKANLSKQQAMMRVNCDAVVELSHTFLKQAKKGDALINVSSGLAFMPMPAAGVYAATKAFVTSFSESLWYEQKERGVYVMGLCPGVTRTRFHDRAGGTDKNRPPAIITQTSEEVVDAAMKALQKRKSPTVISGVQNNIAAAITRALPRKRVVQMMAAFE
jgi:short-subunit dehydrogenase